MGIVGVGIDLVSIPDFAEQVDQPGTAFSETFTPGERRDASELDGVGHLSRGGPRGRQIEKQRQGGGARRSHGGQIFAVCSP